MNNTFVKQAAILAIANILSRLIGFLYRIPLTDLIGDSGNGIYAIGYYTYNLFLILSSAGIPAAISKLVSEKRAIGRMDIAHKIFKTAFFSISIIGFLFMIFIFIFSENITSLFGQPNAALSLKMLSPTVFIVAMMAVIRGYFQGMGSSTPTAISQLIEQIFRAIFAIVFANIMWNFAINNNYNNYEYGAAGAALGAGVGAFFGFIILIIIYFISKNIIIKRIEKDKAKLINTKNISTTKIIKDIFRTAFPIILGTAIFSISTLVDIWLVPNRLLTAGFDEFESIALFGQLSGKFNPITNLPAAISSSIALALIPAIAASYQLKNKKDIKEKMNTAFRISMILTAPIAFVLGFLGSQIVLFLFPNHPDGGGLFLAGFLSIIFLSLSQVSTAVLQGINRKKIPVYSAFFGAFIKIISVFFLVSNPYINIYGAIIGTLLCFLISAIINCIFIQKYTRIKLDKMGIFVKPIIGGLIMGLSSFVFYYFIYFLINSNSISLIMSAFISLPIYIVFMVLVKGIKKSDILALPFGKKIYQLFN